MNPIVIDASVMVRWVLGGGEPGEWERADALIERYDENLHAPAVFFTEFLGRVSGRTKMQGPDRITVDDATAAARRAWAMDITLHAPEPTVDTARVLAFGANLSIPDATYLALAEQLQTVLYTFDRRLIDGAQKLGLGRLAALPE